MQGEYDIKTDPTVPPVQHGRWKVQGGVQGGDQEGVSRDGPPENHHQTDRAHTMGQQSDISKEGKWQAENLP